MVVPMEQWASQPIQDRSADLWVVMLSDYSEKYSDRMERSYKAFAVTFELRFPFPLRIFHSTHVYKDFGFYGEGVIIVCHHSYRKISWTVRIIRTWHKEQVVTSTCRARLFHTWVDSSIFLSLGTVEVRNPRVTLVYWTIFFYQIRAYTQAGYGAWSSEINQSIPVCSKWRRHSHWD